MAFDIWVRKVNQVIEMNTGLGLDDLPDCPYRDWFEQGMSPVKAARWAIRLAN